MEAGFQREGMSQDGEQKEGERDSFCHENGTGIVGNVQVGILQSERGQGIQPWIGAGAVGSPNSHSRGCSQIPE